MELEYSRCMCIYMYVRCMYLVRAWFSTYVYVGHFCIAPDTSALAKVSGADSFAWRTFLGDISRYPMAAV